jgi:hypothetical protein
MGHDVSEHDPFHWVLLHKHLTHWSPRSSLLWTPPPRQHSHSSSPPPNCQGRCLTPAFCLCKTALTYSFRASRQLDHTHRHDIIHFHLTNWQLRNGTNSTFGKTRRRLSFCRFRFSSWRNRTFPQPRSFPWIFIFEVFLHFLNYMCNSTTFTYLDVHVLIHVLTHTCTHTCSHTCTHPYMFSPIHVLNCMVLWKRMYQFESIFEWDHSNQREYKKTAYQSVRKIGNLGLLFLHRSGNSK